MALVEHTNYMDPADYGGRHLVYLGNYRPMDDPLLRASTDDVVCGIRPAPGAHQPRLRPQLDHRRPGRSRRPSRSRSSPSTTATTSRPSRRRCPASGWRACSRSTRTTAGRTTRSTSHSVLSPGSLAMLRTPMPRLIDISVPLARGIPTWPGSTGFHVDQTLSFEKGDGITVSRIDMDVHTGTHVESALHYVEGGDTIETVPLEAFVGTGNGDRPSGGGRHRTRGARRRRHRRRHRAVTATDAELGPSADWRGIPPGLRGADRGRSAMDCQPRNSAGGFRLPLRPTVRRRA